VRLFYNLHALPKMNGCFGVEAASGHHHEADVISFGLSIESVRRFCVSIWISSFIPLELYFLVTHMPIP